MSAETPTEADRALATQVGHLVYLTETGLAAQLIANYRAEQTRELRAKADGLAQKLAECADVLDEVRTGEDFEVVCSEKADDARQAAKAWRAGK